jgi:hypothetical protein
MIMMMPRLIKITDVPKVIGQINERIALCEQRYCEARNIARKTSIDIIKTSAPNDGAYLCSNLNSVNGFVAGLDLDPSMKTADLGGGFGGVSLTLNLRLHNVTSIEYDFRIVSLGIGAQAGLNWWMKHEFGHNGYFSVNFERENILAIDLNSYDLLFLQRPFLDDFEKKMLPQLASLKTGKLVIFATVNRVPAQFRGHLTEVPPLSAPHVPFCLAQRI